MIDEIIENFNNQDPGTQADIKELICRQVRRGNNSLQTMKS